MFCVLIINICSLTGVDVRRTVYTMTGILGQCRDLPRLVRAINRINADCVIEMPPVKGILERINDLKNMHGRMAGGSRDSGCLTCVLQTEAQME